MRDDVARLVEHCRERAGEQCRGVIRYTEDDFEVEYLREELQGRYTKADLAGIVSLCRQIQESRSNRNTGELPLGESESGVLTYERGIVIQIPVSQSSGVLASFDRGVGRNMLEFINECQERVLAE